MYGFPVLYMVLTERYEPLKVMPTSIHPINMQTDVFLRQPRRDRSLLTPRSDGVSRIVPSIASPAAPRHDLSACEPAVHLAGDEGERRASVLA